MFGIICPATRAPVPIRWTLTRKGLLLLLRFAAERLKLKRPSQLALEQIDADLVLAFLEHIELRGASVSTRNARLAAIKAFFRVVEWREPAALEQVARIALIPKKKEDKTMVAWLTCAEIEALLDAPNPRRRDGIRDRAVVRRAILTPSIKQLQ